jgi:hypothetical protein
VPGLGDVYDDVHPYRHERHGEAYEECGEVHQQTSPCIRSVASAGTPWAFACTRNDAESRFQREKKPDKNHPLLANGGEAVSAAWDSMSSSFAVLAKRRW